MKHICIAVAILFILLVPSAATESFYWAGYDWSFTMERPHIIDNSTATIRSYYGTIAPFKYESQDVDLRGAIGSVDSRNGTFLILKDDHYYVAFQVSGNRGIISDMNLSDTVDFIQSLNITAAQPRR